MSGDDTTRLRALLERATQTPWRQDGCEITVVWSTLGVGGGETVIAECTLPDCIEVADEDREEQEERNAALIVGAVNAMPALLDRVEAAEKRVAELEAIIAGRTTPPTAEEAAAMMAAGLRLARRWHAVDKTGTVHPFPAAEVSRG